MPSDRCCSGPSPWITLVTARNALSAHREIRLSRNWLHTIRVTDPPRVLVPTGVTGRSQHTHRNFSTRYDMHSDLTQVRLNLRQRSLNIAPKLGQFDYFNQLGCQILATSPLNSPKWLYNSCKMCSEGALEAPEAHPDVRLSANRVPQGLQNGPKRHSRGPNRSPRVPK